MATDKYRNRSKSRVILRFVHKAKESKNCCYNIIMSNTLQVLKIEILIIFVSLLNYVNRTQRLVSHVHCVSVT